MKTTFYDKRTAQQLERSNEPPASHRFSVADLATFKVHAAHIHTARTRCVGYHKRRKRSRWLTPDGQVIELRGENWNGRNWSEIIRPGIARAWAERR